MIHGRFNVGVGGAIRKEQKLPNPHEEKNRYYNLILP